MDTNEDFTEDNYRKLIRLAKSRYRFAPYGIEISEPHVLWRHDVDFSVHRALRMAQIESEEGVTTSYFLNMHSEFYNLLEKPVFDIAKKILEMGHYLQLHFDFCFYDEIKTNVQLEEKLLFEKKTLESCFQRNVSAFSFHNPTLGGAMGFDKDVIAGMINTYGAAIKSQYHYCSDSNGYWRHERLEDLLTQGTHEKLHILTHPGWWQEKAMPPRHRVLRAANGRANAQMARYDEILYQDGRLNIG